MAVIVIAVCLFDVVDVDEGMNGALIQVQQLMTALYDVFMAVILRLLCDGHHT